MCLPQIYLSLLHSALSCQARVNANYLYESVTYIIYEGIKKPSVKMASNVGAEGGTRTRTSDAHYPLKIACLPISPLRLILNGADYIVPFIACLHLLAQSIHQPAAVQLQALMTLPEALSFPALPQHFPEELPVQQALH
jgi:hypothetical protein